MAIRHAKNTAIVVLGPHHDHIAPKDSDARNQLSAAAVVRIAIPLLRSSPGTATLAIAGSTPSVHA
jgi:hypothetical protein